MPRGQAETPPGADSSETLEGMVERIVYANEQTAWVVARLRVAKHRGPVTAVGRLLGIQVGESLRLTGEWVVEAKYGRQFSASSFLAVRPETLAGIRRYLGSGLVPGIGKVMAGRMVEAFGLSTLDVLEREPERLAEVEGLGPVRIRRIREAWKEQAAVRDVMLFLQTHGLSTSFAARIIKRYGQRAVSVVNGNPFRLAEDIWGIGFDTADRIASSLGIAPDSPPRARAGVLYVLGRAAERGHMFLPRDLLVNRAAELLALEPQAAERAVVELLADDSLRQRRRRDIAHPAPGSAAIYHPDLYRAEVGAAARLRSLLARPVASPEIDVERALTWFQQREKLELGDNQAEAVRRALSAKVLVITGGPGTGKTTLVRAVVRILGKKGRRLALAAPTGRAAKRLAQATGIEVKTIHRLLEYEPRGGAFRRNIDRQLQADLVLIDEASMLDGRLAWQLLDAVPDSAQLVLVGDVDQLASVGPGKVLDEIIRSRAVPVVRLRDIYRQARQSRIVLNAHRIQRGEQPELASRHSGSDFFFIEREEPDEVAATILQLVGDRIPAGFGLDPHTDIQVLTPMRKGPLGADALNLRLQELLNPGGTPSPGPRSLRVGDRVMQTRNNYDLEVYNGDVGRLVSLDEAGGRFDILFEERRVTYETGDQDQLALAYASSVHKAQGSEFECVILPVHTQHFVMLQRNLLYTGVTRARRLLVLVGQRRALARAVSNQAQRRRFTLLAQEIEHQPRG